MKAQSTIEKEKQRLWKIKEFYREMHGDKPGRSWQEDHLFGAYTALSWMLNRNSNPGGGWPEYYEAKEKGEP